MCVYSEEGRERRGCCRKPPHDESKIVRIQNTQHTITPPIERINKPICNRNDVNEKKLISWRMRWAIRTYPYTHTLIHIERYIRDKWRERERKEKDKWQLLEWHVFMLSFGDAFVFVNENTTNKHKIIENDRKMRILRMNKHTFGTKTINKMNKSVKVEKEMTFTLYEGGVERTIGRNRLGVGWNKRKCVPAPRDICFPSEISTIEICRKGNVC